MSIRSASILGLMALALFSLWLLLAGKQRVLGIDSGPAGFALMMLTAWGSLYALYRLPRRDFENAVSPGEWRAWIGTVFMAQLTAYMLLTAYSSRGASLIESPYTGAVGRNVAMMFIAWIVVSWIMDQRLAGQVQEDERDREISRIANSWGSTALAFCVVGMAVTLGLSPAEKLEWAKPPMIAHMLIFSLLWGALVQYAVTAIQYWRDRR